MFHEFSPLLSHYEYLTEFGVKPTETTQL